MVCEAILVGDGSLSLVFLFRDLPCRGQPAESRTEGVLTCVISFVLYFTIPDFPEEAKW